STGMNTLLHAPIQALVQQTEWHDVEQAVETASRQDSTLLFPEENEMEITASHTAVISRNIRNHQGDTTEKIDITSFLAELHSSNGKAETSKEFCLLPDPTNHPCPSLEQKEKAPAVKIDLSEFLLSLKSNKDTPRPPEGPDKENVFFVPSQGSEDVAGSSGEFVCSHEPPDTCNVTKVFRGQEGGMEMTKCEAAEEARPVPAIWGSVSSETVFRGEKTVVFSKCEDMEMTGNYTGIICNDSTTEMDYCQNLGRQDKTHPVRAVNKVLPTRVGSERHFPMGKPVSSGEDLKTSSADGLGTSQPRKGSSQLPLFGGKSVLFPSGENMDLTGSCVVMVPDYTINVVLSQPEAAPGYPGQGANEIMSFKKGATMTTNNQEQPVDPVNSSRSGRKTLSGFRHSADEKTTLFSEGADMDVTRSHTVSVDNRVLFESET
ncbi:KNL1 protein, partial [Smithornis capensis]|nr:KNL1 protein [Smithornis capensis]